MGFFVGGRHSEAVEQLLDFVRGYIIKVAGAGDEERKNELEAALTKAHMIYLCAKCLVKNINREEPSFEELLNEVVEESKLDETEFKEAVRVLTERMRRDLLDRIRRGEVV